jgi:hypothetical protein
MKPTTGNGILMKDQIKGAAKLLFIIQLLLAVLLIWIIKDNRHVSFYITDETTEAVIMEKQALQAYGEMN